MLFSVLVPVYNVEEYLEQCIQSILNQSVNDFEVILVNDGSTDTSSIICDRYANKYANKITVIHKQNEGLISARRTAISHAKGSFCLFVDSDDYVEANWLEVIAKHTHENPDMDILIFSYQYDNFGKIIQRKKTLGKQKLTWMSNNKKELFQYLIFTNTITSIWTKAIRTEILKNDPTNYALYKNKNMAEDLLQTLWPITQAQKIIYVDHVLYNYRYSISSISRSVNANTIDGRNSVHVYHKTLEYLPIWGLNDADTQRQLIARWFNEAMYTMSMYYQSACDAKSKRTILAYDWTSLMPAGAWKNGNKYLSQFYLKLFSALQKRQYFYVKFLFLKKQIASLCKQIMRKIKIGK